jgi:hypothetical protein
MKTLTFEQMGKMSGGFILIPDPSCGDFVPDPRPECDGSRFPFPGFPPIVIAFPLLNVLL